MPRRRAGTSRSGHSDLARFGDPEEDPAGAATLERLALSEEIGAGVDRLMTVVARELQRGAIPRALGRPIPVLLHGPVYDFTFADAAREANPPGLAEDFAAWAERQNLE
jgi:hypothetical protein